MNSKKAQLDNWVVHMESRIKDTNEPSLRNPAVLADKGRIRPVGDFFAVEVATASSLQWTDTIGRMSDKASCRQKPVPLIHRGSFPEQADKENWEDPVNPGSSGKWPLKTEEKDGWNWCLRPTIVV